MGGEGGARLSAGDACDGAAGADEEERSAGLPSPHHRLSGPAAPRAHLQGTELAHRVDMASSTIMMMRAKELSSSASCENKVQKSKEQHAFQELSGREAAR